MLPFLFKIIGVPLIGAVISIVIAWLSINKLHSTSSFSFAVKTLLVSQIIFLLVSAYLFVMSDGYIVFALGIIVFINSIAGIFSFIGGLLFHRLYLSKNSLQKQSSPIANIFILTTSVVILLGSFIFGGGTFIMTELTVSAAKLTGSKVLVNMLGDLVSENARSEVYIKNAAKHGDVSVCDEMNEVDVMQKNNCYEAVDPDYLKAQENCDLYTKFISSEENDYADNDQAKCVINNLAVEQYLQKQLNCTELITRFKNNDFYYNVIDRKCQSLETLQDVVLTGKPINCDGYSNLNDQEARAVCYSEFIGTPEHSQFCRYVEFETRQHGEDYYYLEHASVLAKCPDAVAYYTGYNPTLTDVFGAFSTPPSYVPGEYVFESWDE